MKTPSFWRAGDRSLLALALSPLGCLYGFGTSLRLRFGRRARIGVPVVCVGNLVAGGAGKTPLVIDLATRLKARGLNVHIMTRGYGGTVFGPHLVSGNDSAAEVGDEALLLARAAPTWVSDDRRKGCRHAVQEGAEAIILDDGFQDPSVVQTLSLVVVDGGFGFGNGRLVPAGPLREPVHKGLERADAMIVIGEDVHDAVGHAGNMLPVLGPTADLDPSIAEFAKRRLLAFAGIGRPAKFFDALRDAGMTLADTRPFADHHTYTAAELRQLREDAAATDAVLVTTEKDFVRLAPADRVGISAIAMSLNWPDEAALDALLARVRGDDG